MFTAKPRNDVLNGRATKKRKKPHASRCLPQNRNPPSYAQSVSAAIFRVKQFVRKARATKDVTPGENQYPPSESSGTLRGNPPHERSAQLCADQWTPTQSPLRGTEARTGAEAYTNASLDLRIGETDSTVNAYRRQFPPDPFQIPLAPSGNHHRRKGACRSRTCPSIPYS